MNIRCATCGRYINEIESIVESCKLTNKSLEEYVRTSDLVSDTNEIICNDCYLYLGLPSLPVGELLMNYPDVNNKFVEMCKDKYRKVTKDEL